MNIFTIKNVALGLALTATAFCAKAQKTYTQGSIVYNINVNAQDVETTAYFKGDTSSFSSSRGPATIKMIGTSSVDYFAVLVDVPVAGMKKAAVSNPGELEEAKDKDPIYTYTPTTEAKKIGDFNCKKLIAKDSKSGTTYDLWITNDVVVPANIISRLYANAGGTPVEFTIIQMGFKQVCTIKSIVDVKVPEGTFSISKDYDKITMTDLQAMGGKKQ